MGTITTTAAGTGWVAINSPTAASQAVLAVFGNSKVQLDMTIGVNGSNTTRSSLNWLQALTHYGFRLCKSSSYTYTSGAINNNYGIFGHAGAAFAPINVGYMLYDLPRFLEQLKEEPTHFWFKEIWENDLGGNINNISSLAQLKNAVIQGIKLVHTKFPNCIIMFSGPGCNGAYATSANPTLSSQYYYAMDAWLQTAFITAPYIKYVSNKGATVPGSAGVAITNATVDGVHYNMRGALMMALDWYNQFGSMFSYKLQIPITPYAVGQPLVFSPNPDFSVTSTNLTQGTSASTGASPFNAAIQNITHNCVSGSTVLMDTYLYNGSTATQAMTVNWADPVNKFTSDFNANSGLSLSITTTSSYVNTGAVYSDLASCGIQIGQAWLAPYQGNIKIPNAQTLTTPFTFACRVKVLDSTNLYALGLLMGFSSADGATYQSGLTTSYLPEEDATYYEYTVNPAGISGLLPAGTELTLLLPTILNTNAAGTVIRDAFMEIVAVNGATTTPIQLQVKAMCVFQEDTFSGSVVLNPATTVPYVNDTKNTQQIIVSGGVTYTTLVATLGGTAVTLPTAFAGAISLNPGDSLTPTFSSGTAVFTITNLTA